MELAETRDSPGIAVETRFVDFTSGVTGVPAAERHPTVTGGTASPAVRIALPAIGGVEPRSRRNAPGWGAELPHSGRNVDVKRRGPGSRNRRVRGSKVRQCQQGRRGGRWGLREHRPRVEVSQRPVTLTPEYGRAHIHPLDSDGHLQRSRQGFTTTCDRSPGRFELDRRRRSPVGEPGGAVMAPAE